jgi:hypothetical protein
MDYRLNQEAKLSAVRTLRSVLQAILPAHRRYANGQPDPQYPTHGGYRDLILTTRILVRNMAL